MMKDRQTIYPMLRPFFTMLFVLFFSVYAVQGVFAQEKFSFAFLTDLHLNNNTKVNSFGGLEKALQQVRKSNVDFIMTGGDNVDVDGIKADQFQVAKDLYSRYQSVIANSGLKWYMTIGNHDRYWHSPNTSKAYGEDLFTSFFGDTYYSFDHKGWKFIVLNTAEVCDGKYCVSDQQYSWLENVLANTAKDQPIVVSVHVPFLSLYYPVLEGRYTATDTFGNQKQVFDMFADHDLKLVLQGHQHLYEEIKVKGVQFITAGAVSANWWHGPFHGTEEGFLKVNIDGNDFSWEYVDYGWKTEQDKVVKKSLFVIVDGIPPDVIERVSTPWIDKIAVEGGYTRAYTGGLAGTYSESPTISAVCYAHLVTGTWTNKHNIWGNGLENPNFNYPTIFRYFKDAYPEKSIGIFSTWEDNRTKLIGEGRSETGQLKFDYYADGYELDTINYPHDSQSHYIHLIDEKVSQEAARNIRENAPDMSWVYLQYTDDIGHRFGDSPQMDDAVRKADHQVGRMWQAVQERVNEFGEEWLVYIVTDHGRDDKGFHHGGQSPRERGIWFATNDKNLNNYFHQETPGLVDVMPSVLRFMEVNLPREQAFEVDGIPLSGEVSHVFTSAVLDGNTLNLKWKPMKQDGELEVWVSVTNLYQAGEKDEYQSLGKVPVKNGSAQFDLSHLSGEPFKVVLESKDHTANKWIVR